MDMRERGHYGPSAENTVKMSLALLSFWQETGPWTQRSILNICIKGQKRKMLISLLITEHYNYLLCIIQENGRDPASQSTPKMPVAQLP